jgi:hypothetical protein
MHPIPTGCWPSAAFGVGRITGIQSDSFPELREEQIIEQWLSVFFTIRHLPLFLVASPSSAFAESEM